MGFSILNGDVISQLQTLEDNSVDSIITDPPYNLGMDEWDTWPSNEAFGDWCEEWGREAYRVLKPGGSILSFSASRTYHWMACGLEKAGFTSRDMIEWVYWASMPKGKNLKSCHEPIYFGVKGKPKPINIEACRVPLTPKTKSALDSVLLPNMPTGKHPGRGAYGGDTEAKIYKKAMDDKPYIMNENGRHPFNVVTLSIADATFPTNVMDVKKPRGKESIKGHQTQKPVALMSWMVNLVTQPGDTVLDCFGGTGTTGEAALTNARNVIIIERDSTYINIIKERLDNLDNSLLEF